MKKRFIVPILPFGLLLLAPILAGGGERIEAADPRKASAGSSKPAPRAPQAKKVASTTEPAEPEDGEIAPKSNRKTAVAWQAVLKVVNPSDVRERIEKAARTLGGHPTFFDDKRVLVKLPHAALPELTGRIAEMGLLLRKTIHREDLTLRIAELEGKLKSKREILARTRGFLDDADMPATLDIERTMTQLVSETESVRGELRVLYDRATFAEVAVDFEFRERDKVFYVDSPFGWLNTVDLDRFVQEF